LETRRKVAKAHGPEGTEIKKKNETMRGKKCSKSGSAHEDGVTSEDSKKEIYNTNNGRRGR